MKTAIPSQLQSKLWSSNVNKLGLQKDKTTIVHRVLSYGDLEDIKLLFNMYGRSELEHEFLANPMNIYTKSGLNFTKNYILDLESTPVDEKKYVKTVY